VLWQAPRSADEPRHRAERKGSLRHLHSQILRGGARTGVQFAAGERQACEAFIASQRHEGWVCLRTGYDDGGFSGATTSRPALQRLLADIRVIAPSPPHIKRNRKFVDSPLEGTGFELVWGFSCQVVPFGLLPFLCSERKAVLRPVACDQVSRTRGRGRGTETLVQLGGLPLSGACVSQRPLFKPGAGFDA